MIFILGLYLFVTLCKFVGFFFIGTAILGFLVNVMINKISIQSQLRQERKYDD